MPKIYDISPLISPEIAVWPGDVAFSRTVNLDIDDGAVIDLSSVTTTVHLGAHADAPRHYRSEGDTIEKVALEPYLGPCTLIDVGPVGLIEPHHFIEKMPDLEPRVLFRTRSYPNPNRFNEDFTAFSFQTIEKLAQKGAILVGIDTPSVDPFHSKELPAHQTLFKTGIYNLEGLVLNDIPEGNYELIALPLKLAQSDASPVRAVLREIN